MDETNFLEASELPVISTVNEFPHATGTPLEKYVGLFTLPIDKPIFSGGLTNLLALVTVISPHATGTPFEKYTGKFVAPIFKFPNFFAEADSPVISTANEFPHATGIPFKKYVGLFEAPTFFNPPCSASTRVLAPELLPIKLTFEKSATSEFNSILLPMLIFLKTLFSYLLSNVP